MSPFETPTVNSSLATSFIHLKESLSNCFREWTNQSRKFHLNSFQIDNTAVIEIDKVM